MRDPRTAPAIKICGLTDVNQALAIAAMGVDAIGVIGVPKTPRYLEEMARSNLFQALEQQVPELLRVWVVANPDDATLDRALQGEGQPSVVQLHGSEDSDRCRELKQRYPNQRWWKALRIRQPEDVTRLNGYEQAVDGLLLDAWSPEQLGGTGHRLPLEWIADAAPSLPWWLAGGISAEWIPELLSQVSPDGLDASSRLEIRPGWKDLSKVQALVQAVGER